MWAKFDDQFYLNPKNATIDRDEQDLYMASLVYCNGQLTDGFVPTTIISLLAVWAKLPSEAIAQAIASHLVEHRYWEIASNGYMVHDFLDWNLSKAEVLELRAARSEAGKRGGRASGATRRAKEAIAKANAKASAQAKSKQNRTPSPSPSPLIKEATPPLELSIVHKMFLGTFGAKRLNNEQIKAIADIESKYPENTIKEFLEWARINSFTLGRAISSAKTALPNWGKPKRNGNGNNQPQEPVHKYREEF